MGKAVRGGRAPRFVTEIYGTDRSGDAGRRQVWASPFSAGRPTLRFGAQGVQEPGRSVR